METQPKTPNRLSMSTRRPHRKTQDFFYCSYQDCNYKNNWEENVGRHEQSHNPTGYWDIPCQVCPQVFGFLVSFFYHMSSQHSNKLFCPWCLFLGRDWDEFKAHMLAHISTPGEACLETAKTTGQFSCGTCSKTFTSTRDLCQHEKYSCTPNSFSTASTTTRADIHNRSQASSDLQPEDSEFESTTAPNEVGQVLQRSLTTSGLFCGNCSKTFANKSSLARHQKNHCNASNSAEVQNQKYLTKAITEPRALLGCDKCSYKTSRGDNLRTHSRIHWSVKPFKCPNLGCAYKTHLAQSLQRHLRFCQGRIHTAAETWGEISIAAVGKVKLEGRPDTLIKKVNEEQARYSCSICSFRSNWKQGLRSHLKVHFGQKPFSCPIRGCMYRSKWPQNLRRHSKFVHQSESLKATLKTKENSGLDKECGNQTEVNVRSSSSMTFACMLCDFIGDSELSALKHACQHRTVVISLNRI